MWSLKDGDDADDFEIDKSSGVLSVRMKVAELRGCYGRRGGAVRLTPTL